MYKRQGLGIDVLLFQRMNYHKVAFSFPVIPVVVMIVTPVSYTHLDVYKRQRRKHLYNET